MRICWTKLLGRVSIFSPDVIKFEENLAVLGGRHGMAHSLIKLCGHVIPVQQHLQVSKLDRIIS